MDFDTNGIFSVSGWFKAPLAGTRVLASLREQGQDFTWQAWCDASYFYFGMRHTNVTSYAKVTTHFQDSTWHYMTGVRNGTTTSLYIDGVLQDTNITSVTKGTLTDADVRLGVHWDGNYAYNGSLALWRVSATAPTAEQIKEIYEAEKPLFQENAKCTLNGTSDAVTAMSYDDSNEELLVGTSGGLSVFKGLRRVDENTNNITEVAQQGSLRVEEY
jgi:hypothetical protein